MFSSAYGGPREVNERGLESTLPGTSAFGLSFSRIVRAKYKLNWRRPASSVPLAGFPSSRTLDRLWIGSSRRSGAQVRKASSAIEVTEP